MFWEQGEVLEGLWRGFLGEGEVGERLEEGFEGLYREFLENGRRFEVDVGNGTALDAEFCEELLVGRGVRGEVDLAGEDRRCF